jgi:hypothetical protein
LLGLVKGERLRTGYEKVIFQALETEKGLEALLDKASQGKASLETLEKISSEISRKQAEYIERISDIEEDLQTLQVVIRNLELVLGDSTWDGCRSQARELLSVPFELFREQMESDLRYLRITQQQADLTLQSQQTEAGVRGTQWDRRTTLVLGIFAVFQVAQLFVNFPLTRTATVLVVSAIVVGLAVVIFSYLRLRRR